MVACIEERYPYIIEDVPEKSDVQSDEDGTGKVPIFPTFANSAYGIITRSTGVFEDWGTDSVHWMKVPFKVYAYWSSPTGSNYRATGLPYCLINGDTLKIVDVQGNVKFEHGTEFIDRFYPAEYPDNRYKFYTFYCDSLIPIINKTATTVTATMELDGTSDLIHSYAYHPDSVFDATLAALPFNDDVCKRLRETGQSLLYSTTAGSRAINPLFHLNHMLARFDIYIQGAEGLNTDYSFLNMLIDEITIDAPKQVTLKVADDSWTGQTYEAEVAAGTLVSHTANDTYQLDILPKRIDNTSYNQSKLGYDYGRIRKEWELQHGLQDTSYFHVCDTTERRLCKTVLVPPMASYRLVMKGRAMNIAADGTLTPDKDGKYYRNVISEAELTLREGGAFLPFKAGTKYTLIIYVYNDGGRITATVTGIDEEQWADGGYEFEIQD